MDLIVLPVEGSHRELPALSVLRDAADEVHFFSFLILIDFLISKRLLLRSFQRIQIVLFIVF